MINKSETKFFLRFEYHQQKNKFDINADLHSRYFDNLNELASNNILNRIWEKDFTVWSKEPAEISNRLGWLESPDKTLSQLNEIQNFVQEIQDRGFKNILLLGMGGSSLAPEMFGNIFRSGENYPKLSVVDSTSPVTIKKISEKFDPKDTLYIVSTKSGGTVETLSFLKFFYNHCKSRIGPEYAGRHFAAITDPGSGLQTIAEELKFRKIFLNDPNIGGRYSGLSLFGMVPAALIGIDLKRLLLFTELMMKNCGKEKSNEIFTNSSAVIGSVLGQLTTEGKDKLTFFISNELKDLGAWLEQLIAESTGKEGKGILPVDLEAPEDISVYSEDRVFVFIRLKDDHSYEHLIKNFANHNYPVFEIILNDIYELGGEMFRWEMITIVASHIMNVQPFDQPNVESAKIVARAMVNEFKEKGKLRPQTVGLKQENLELIGKTESADIFTAVKTFLDQAIVENDTKNCRNYIALQAFVPPSDESSAAFAKLRKKLLQNYKVATTFGYGPRFLHSTGQLHKGDAGNGLFIQFICENEVDVSIPDDAGREESSISFGILIEAQALGDRQALIDNQRNVLTLKIKGDISGEIEKFTENLNFK